MGQPHFGDLSSTTKENVGVVLLSVLCGVIPEVLLVPFKTRGPTYLTLTAGCMLAARWPQLFWGDIIATIGCGGLMVRGGDFGRTVSDLSLSHGLPLHSCDILTGQCHRKRCACMRCVVCIGEVYRRLGG